MKHSPWNHMLILRIIVMCFYYLFLLSMQQWGAAEFQHIPSIFKNLSILYLFQVCVTPGFPISKHSRHYPSLSIILYFFTSRASLYAAYLTCGCIGDIDSHQLAAREPQGGVSWRVVGNPQQEFTVVIVDLLCLCGSIKINWKEVSAINLFKANKMTQSIMLFKPQPPVISTKLAIL